MPFAPFLFAPGVTEPDTTVAVLENDDGGRLRAVAVDDV